MKRFIYMLAAFALMGAVSCQPDEEVAVHALSLIHISEPTRP